MSVQESTSIRDAVIYLGALFDDPEVMRCNAALPGLQRFIARATRQVVPVYDSVSFVNWVASAQSVTMPIAAICRFGESGKTDEHCWLRADPVHLQPTQDTLRLFAAAPAGGELVSAVAAHLALDGWLVEASEAGHWYLRAPEELRCETTSSERVEGADVFAFMPAGEHGPRLRSLMNDVQMLAHQHLSGAPAQVNSVWPWGQGCWLTTPAAPAKELPPGFGRHPYLRGLWRHWSAPVAAPDDAINAIANGGGLVAIPELPEGESGLIELEARWLSPLLTSLSGGRVDAVWLVLRHGLSLRLGQRELRRFWRRPRPLADILPDLARKTA